MRRIQMRRTGSGRRTNAGLLSFTRFYSVLLGFTRFYSVLLSFTRSTLFSFNQVKVNKRETNETNTNETHRFRSTHECRSTQFYSVLLGFTRFYSVYSVFFQPSFSDYSVLLGFTYDGSVLLGIALYYLTQTFTTY